MGADTSWPCELGVVYASWSRGRRVTFDSSELEKPFCPMIVVVSLTCRTMSPSFGAAEVHHAATRSVTFHPYQPVTFVIPATVATTAGSKSPPAPSHGVIPSRLIQVEPNSVQLFATRCTLMSIGVLLITKL